MSLNSENEEPTLIEKVAYAIGGDLDKAGEAIHDALAHEPKDPAKL